ncbi:YcxB family protein [Luteolibacter soli]|uniref:YcxB family protein n=1 Tax=Luteolibacter soli TaxID=3135280 RepID=A0ABU9ANY7_9BACT
MSFTYQPVFRDYLTLSRHVLWAQLKLAIILGGVVTLGALIQPFAAWYLVKQSNPEAHIEIGLMNVAIPLLALLFAVSIHASIKKRWNKLEALRATVEYEFEDLGLNVRSGLNRSFIEWKQFAHTEVTKHHILLKTVPGAYFYFPKFVVPNLEELLRFLAGKIPVKGA